MPGSWRTLLFFGHLVFAFEMEPQMLHPQRPIHPDDLMKPDLLSQTLLVGSGIVLFAPLLLILVVALTH
jgi:hypothetical protein